MQYQCSVRGGKHPVGAVTGRPGTSTGGRARLSPKRCPRRGSTTPTQSFIRPIFVGISWRYRKNPGGPPLAVVVSEARKEADPMTRRSLSAWLLMAVMATPAMMPAVANAHPVSTVANAHQVSTQNPWRRAATTRQGEYGQAFASSSSWRGGGSQSYRLPQRASGGWSLSSRSQTYRQPARVSSGFSSHSFSPWRTEQFRAPLVLRHDDRRR
jgi:hypothetical protein